ncbi:hypothetical protein POTOM_053778 [Populus tomentosa]|uniref:Uncharacterized protein n=2 Tax=Populus TaxID=3689 RepID=A0A8X7XY03_POPTO|nr:hypothetical protein POTOM_053778 [Populus tomentosa]
MVALMPTAAIPTLHPPECAPGGAFAFLVIGAGGIRPCNLAFGAADQFNPNTVDLKESTGKDHKICKESHFTLAW